MLPRRVIARFVADYGMVLVLLLLCGLFSVLTLSEQRPTSDAAARRLAGEFSKGARVLIAVREQSEDAAFARELESAFRTRGVELIGVVKGEPKDARAALMKIT